MVDLKNQYINIKDEVRNSIDECLISASFINGPFVKKFQKSLETYLDVKYVIPCANGTDALQIALMSLGLNKGDEVICPAFTYVATAEVIGLLGLTPKMVDVNPNTFNIDVENLKSSITKNTKAIVPVHLFGQSSDMEKIMSIAKDNNLFVIEDNAQAIGCDYSFSNGDTKKTGTIGDIGCTSFFPSKNLGCYGDGGAIMTNNDLLAEKIRMIANHGQNKKYFHKVLGCNSRLDTIQAGILDVKLKYLDNYNSARIRTANYYDSKLNSIENILIPKRDVKSSHVFNQYTLRILNGKRNHLKQFLNDHKVPCMIYYPLPLYKQEAFKNYVTSDFHLPNTETLCDEVLSLPIHSEYNEEHLAYITNVILNFFKEGSLI